MRGHLGLDFGTTNSALALADDAGDVTLAHFDERETFRSVLHFLCPERPGAPPSVEAGPLAIARYLESGGDGRLIQSIKSFLATRSFHETRICDLPWTLEQLVGLLLERLRREAEERLGPLGHAAVVGRPVHFAGPGRSGDDDVAEARLRAALARAGFDDVTFVLEPVAAACHYELALDHDELVFIADFGGGTSDFSLLRLGPHARDDEATRRVLASDGVGIAGDAFDAQMIRHVVSPALGRGTEYETTTGKALEVPRWLYSHLEQWHTLSMLKTPRNLNLMRRLLHEAREPERIGWLLFLVEADLGFALHEAVDRAKQALSREEETELVFDEPPLRLRARVTRADFERWIGAELEAIAACADRTLRTAGVEARDVDRVFMTGGSSFVPAVRRIFEERFGAGRLRGGGEFVSVARGLATYGHSSREARAAG
jgi:hypothetical chaperone protein